MDAQKILSEIKNGKKLYVLNYLHGWIIDYKTVQKFNNLGIDVIKQKGNELYMRQGNKYVCISGCKLEIV